MGRLLSSLAHALFAFWVGAMACVAFVVAPAVFGHVTDRTLAGQTMQGIFRLTDLYGVGATVLFALAAGRRMVRTLLAGLLAAGALVNVFVLAPHIARRGADFDTYHRASTVLWGSMIVAGIALSLLGPRGGGKS